MVHIRRFAWEALERYCAIRRLNVTGSGDELTLVEDLILLAGVSPEEAAVELGVRSPESEAAGGEDDRGGKPQTPGCSPTRPRGRPHRASGGEHYRQQDASVRCSVSSVPTPCLVCDQDRRCLWHPAANLPGVRRAVPVRLPSAGHAGGYRADDERPAVAALRGGSSARLPSGPAAAGTAAGAALLCRTTAVVAGMGKLRRGRTRGWRCRRIDGFAWWKGATMLG